MKRTSKRSPMHELLEQDWSLDDGCLAELTAMIDLSPELVSWLQDQRESTGVSVAEQICRAVEMMRLVIEAARTEPAESARPIAPASHLVH